MTFGSRLREVRKAKNLSQEALGALLGGNEPATKQTVYGWEKDKHFPRVDQLALLCEKLGCSADYLLLGSNPPAKPISSEAAEVAYLIDALDPTRKKALIDYLHFTYGAKAAQESGKFTDSQRRANG
jgi:transcriptional regulator with XRE-family HTH domain